VSEGAAGCRGDRFSAVGFAGNAPSNYDFTLLTRDLTRASREAHRHRKYSVVTDGERASREISSGHSPRSPRRGGLIFFSPPSLPYAVVTSVTFTRIFIPPTLATGLTNALTDIVLIYARRIDETSLPHLVAKWCSDNGEQTITIAFSSRSTESPRKRGRQPRYNALALAISTCSRERKPRSSVMRRMTSAEPSPTIDRRTCNECVARKARLNAFPEQR